jgi:biofilm PGA synthesis protein PgaA
MSPPSHFPGCGRKVAFVAALMATLLSAVAAHAQNAERVEAVRWARDGELDRAIARLQELRVAYPQDLPIATDLVVILGWVGRDREMLEVFETIGPDAAFDYALFAAARSARAVGELDRAGAYLKRGAERFPDQSRWAVLLALVYVDGGRFEEARQVLTASYGTDPSDLEGLLAWAYLSAQAQELPAALRYYTEVLKQRPENREALEGRTIALEALGAPFRADELIRESGGLLNQAERDRVAETGAALRLRWGRLPTPDPARRYDATDRAIAILERRVAELEARGDSAGAALQRARFDLLVAYRDRSRMRDAVAVYERLRQEGVTVPAYARLSAASAYLYLENPETARDLYQSVVDENPRDAEVRFEAHLGLYYAWVELERYDRAYAAIDALDREQSPFLGYLDTGASVENESKSATAVAAALARFYAGQLAEAWDRLSPLAARAPAASWLQADLASVARARGWPRRSLELLEPWMRAEPHNVDIKVGQAGSLLALRRYPEAGLAIEELYRVYPESKTVQNLKREWDVHRMWEWITRVEPNYGSEPTAPGVGIAITTRLWSPPVGDYWRVTGAYRYATDDLPEGRETFQRAAAGLEYRGPSLRAFAELTYNESTEDGLGGRAEIEWTPTDQLSLSAVGEIFSRDTPMRALKNGVTADAVELGAGYQFQESRGLGLTWRLMDFSDGNVRNELFPRFTQRVLDRPGLTLTGIVELYYSTNSRTDVAYFSPGWIFTPTVALVAEHVAWRRYRRSFVHALTGTIGGTFQQGFDGEPIGILAYEHRWQLGPQVDLSYGILFGSRVFDGDREQEVAGFTQLSVRF